MITFCGELREVAEILFIRDLKSGSRAFEWVGDPNLPILVSGQLIDLFLELLPVMPWKLALQSYDETIDMYLYIRDDE